MSSQSAGGGAVICSEVFDENSQPSDADVKEYAAKIGINVKTEPHLLYLAREGLNRELPQEWKPCWDEAIADYYYFNFETGETRWDHPLDEVYKEKVKRDREQTGSKEAVDDKDHDLTEPSGDTSDLLPPSNKAKTEMNPMAKLAPLPTLGKPLKPLAPLNALPPLKKPPPLEPTLDDPLKKPLVKPTDLFVPKTVLVKPESKGQPLKPPEPEKVANKYEEALATTKSGSPEKQNKPSLSLNLKGSNFMKPPDAVEPFNASPASSSSSDAVEIVVDDVGDKVRSILKSSVGDRQRDLASDERRLTMGMNDKKVKFASESEEESLHSQKRKPPTAPPRTAHLPPRQLSSESSKSDGDEAKDNFMDRYGLYDAEVLLQPTTKSDPIKPSVIKRSVNPPDLDKISDDDSPPSLEKVTPAKRRSPIKSLVRPRSAKPKLKSPKPMFGELSSEDESSNGRDQVLHSVKFGQDVLKEMQFKRQNLTRMNETQVKMELHSLGSPLVKPKVEKRMAGSHGVIDRMEEEDKRKEERRMENRREERRMENKREEERRMENKREEERRMENKRDEERRMEIEKRKEDERRDLKKEEEERAEEMHLEFKRQMAELRKELAKEKEEREKEMKREFERELADLKTRLTEELEEQKRRLVQDLHQELAKEAEEFSKRQSDVKKSKEQDIENELKKELETYKETLKEEFARERTKIEESLKDKFVKDVHELRSEIQQSRLAEDREVKSDGVSSRQSSPMNFYEHPPRIDFPPSTLHDQIGELKTRLKEDFARDIAELEADIRYLRIKVDEGGRDSREDYQSDVSEDDLELMIKDYRRRFTKGHYRSTQTLESDADSLYDSVPTIDVNRSLHNLQQRVHSLERGLLAPVYSTPQYLPTGFTAPVPNPIAAPAYVPPSAAPRLGISNGWTVEEQIYKSKMWLRQRNQSLMTKP